MADRQIPEAGRLPEPVLRDHMPVFVDALATVLDRPRPSADGPPSLGTTLVSESHARQRFAHEYSLGSALREWTHFRTTVIGTIYPDAVANPELMAAVNEIDAATVRVATEMHDADVARRSALEAERDRALAILEALMTAAPVGLAFVDPQLRYVRINEALAQMNGVSVRATLGRSVAAVVPSLAPFLVEHFTRVFETGLPSLDVEISGTTAGSSGQVRHWLNSFYPVRHQNGELFKAGHVMVDITERMAQQQRLRDALSFRDRSIAILGHDLRTPLGAIVMGAHLIVQQSPSQAIAGIAQRVERSAKRMSKMINDLLDLTRTQLGNGIPIEVRPTDLAQVARAVLDELEIERPGRRATFESQGDCTGQWDSDRLAQVVSNLVSNALDYGRRGTDVRVRIEGEPDVVRLTVTNEGTPIPPDAIATIFDPFRRAAQPDSNPKGLGLGLHIVKSIVEAHGGSVSVVSGADTTTFQVALPRRGAAERQWW